MRGSGFWGRRKRLRGALFFSLVEFLPRIRPRISSDAPLKSHGPCSLCKAAACSGCCCGDPSRLRCFDRATQSDQSLFSTAEAKIGPEIQLPMRLWLCAGIRSPIRSPTRPLPTPCSLLHGIFLGFGAERLFPEPTVRDALAAPSVNCSYWVRAGAPSPAHTHKNDLAKPNLNQSPAPFPSQTPHNPPRLTPNTTHPLPPSLQQKTDASAPGGGIASAQLLSPWKAARYLSAHARAVGLPPTSLPSERKARPALCASLAVVALWRVVLC